MMVTSESNRLLDLAATVIRESVQSFQRSETVDGRIDYEQGRDIKLHADRFLSDQLTTRLQRATGIACLSEEDAATVDSLGRDPVWIIDPLDGSMNYQRGIPLACIAIALWHNGASQLGLIYDLASKQLFAAANGMVGHGSELLGIRRTPSPERAILATGIPVMAELDDLAARTFFEFFRCFKKIRMLGSAGLSLAWVAAGKIDAYFERDIMLWDVAAGLALVEAAGGICLVRPGRHVMSREVVAANGELAKVMVEKLQW